MLQKIVKKILQNVFSAWKGLSLSHEISLQNQLITNNLNANFSVLFPVRSNLQVRNSKGPGIVTRLP